MNTQSKIKTDWMKPSQNFIRNKRPEMNDVETNPGPARKQSYRDYQQWELREYRIETAQALHKIDERKEKKGKKPNKEYLLKRIS